MMPDLGKYATEVLSAYGVTLLLILALVLLTLRQSARTRRALRQVEAAHQAKANGLTAKTKPRNKETPQDG
ncbi:heme exporter protein CcmD [Tropicimonas isoalkanivorans]|uniref:Heme exporter protein D n=1 Tax=Tropicimonas isoalkanivorans TaxID=441112 RepID=A0A1I1KAR2_9RHOB|nr:Heme exporter protein D (CcmD) [Tropicimonas isoalkanivorans]